MELEDLKSEWQKTNPPTKKLHELKAMTQLKNHSVLKRVRVKLLVEMVLFVAFLLVYYDGFDGDKKPLWVNILLVISGLMFIINDFVGLLSLQKPIVGTNLVESIKNLSKRMNDLMVFSLLSSILFGIGIIVFFTSGIHFTQTKYILLTVILISLGVMLYISYKNWRYRLDKIRKAGEELKA